MKTMTVSELIDALWALEEGYDDAPVFVWVDGERYPVVGIDDQIEGHLDINVGVES